MKSLVKLLASLAWIHALALRAPDDGIDYRAVARRAINAGNVFADEWSAGRRR